MSTGLVTPGAPTLPVVPLDPTAEWAVAVLDDPDWVGDLLDWLDAHGVALRQVEARPPGRFVVRWPAPARPS